MPMGEGWAEPLVTEAIDVLIEGGSTKLILLLELRSAVPLGRGGREETVRSGNVAVTGAPLGKYCCFLAASW